MNCWVPCNLAWDLVVGFECCRLEGTHELDEGRIFAQRRELLILQRVLNVRIPFLSGFAQIKPAMLGVSLSPIHLGNHVMEISTVTLGSQFDRNTAGR